MYGGVYKHRSEDIIVFLLQTLNDKRTLKFLLGFDNALVLLGFGNVLVLFIFLHLGLGTGGVMVFLTLLVLTGRLGDRGRELFILALVTFGFFLAFVCLVSPSFRFLVCDFEVTPINQSFRFTRHEGQ